MYEYWIQPSALTRIHTYLLSCQTESGNSTLYSTILKSVKTLLQRKHYTDHTHIHTHTHTQLDTDLPIMLKMCLKMQPPFWLWRIGYKPRPKNQISSMKFHSDINHLTQKDKRVEFQPEIDIFYMFLDVTCRDMTILIDTRENEWSRDCTCKRLWS